MTIYVDPLKARGWILRSGAVKSSHLICDGNLDELHAFAFDIGLKRAWFQPRSYPHYDLIEGRRWQALRAGATEVNAKRAIEILRAAFPKPHRRRACHASTSKI